jgi:hypothetical protein
LGSNCSESRECETKNCFRKICRDKKYCETTSNCGYGEYCFNNKCETLKPVNLNCSNSTECETNNCFKNVCREIDYCESAADCDSGKQCRGNKCGNLKPAGSGCSNGMECETQNCFKGMCREIYYCESNTDCSNGNVCSGNVCEQIYCTEGYGCSFYQSCSNNRCEIAWIYVIAFIVLISILSGVAYFLMKIKKEVKKIEVEKEVEKGMTDAEKVAEAESLTNKRKELIIRLEQWRREGFDIAEAKKELDKAQDAKTLKKATGVFKIFGEYTRVVGKIEDASWELKLIGDEQFTKMIADIKHITDARKFKDSRERFESLVDSKVPAKTNEAKNKEIREHIKNVEKLLQEMQEAE